MPPKGVHSKKAAAMEKKAANEAVKEKKKEAHLEAQEAAAWNDGADARSAKRREEQEKKAQEKDAKKAELRMLQEQEEAAAAAIKPKVKKVNSKQAAKDKELKELEAQLRAMELAKKQKDEKNKKAAAGGGGGGGGGGSKKGKKKGDEDDDWSSDDEGLPPLEANPNRAMAGVETARNLDQALNLLGGKGGDAGGDAHPEKRQKAAYKAYEERMLVELKEDMPGLRLSQYKQKIFEMWQKAPENPMVAARAAAAGLEPSLSGKKF